MIAQQRNVAVNGENSQLLKLLQQEGRRRAANDRIQRKAEKQKAAMRHKIEAIAEQRVLDDYLGDDPIEKLARELEREGTRGAA